MIDRTTAPGAPGSSGCERAGALEVCLVGSSSHGADATARSAVPQRYLPSSEPSCSFNLISRLLRSLGPVQLLAACDASQWSGGLLYRFRGKPAWIPVDAR
eukprot:6177362-Pleurochrysis_carterae.AAC.3